MTDRYERGLARQREIGGAGGVRTAVYDELADIAPDLSRFAVEFAYGDIHARPGLDAARRELVILGALIATGVGERHLEAHVDTALNVGLEPGEVVEAVMQVLPYAGFPRVMSAMIVVARVLRRRGLTVSR